MRRSEGVRARRLEIYFRPTHGERVRNGYRRPYAGAGGKGPRVTHFKTPDGPLKPRMRA
jgi:hypothetical protein